MLCLVLAYSYDKFYRLGKSFIGYISDLCIDTNVRGRTYGEVG